MKDKLLKIISFYGLPNQLKYIHSEYYELDEAILSFPYKKEHVAEELADCFVMLKQLQYYFKIEDYWIDEIMRKKIDRQLKRIEEE